MIYGELERYPLIIERKVKILSYWLKIVHNESSLLVQKVYSLMYVAVTRNAMLENWASLVRKLDVTKCGYSKVCQIDIRSLGNVNKVYETFTFKIGRSWYI